MRSTLYCLILGLGVLISADGTGAAEPQKLWYEDILNSVVEISEFFSENATDGSDNISTCVSARYGVPCACQEGYRRTSKVFYQSSAEYLCERIPYQCKLDPGNENANMCLNATKQNDSNHNYCLAMRSTISILQSACENGRSSASLKETAKSFDTFSNALSQIKMKNEIVSAVTFALKGVSTTALTTALASPDKPTQTITSELVAIQTHLISKEQISKNQILKLEARGDRMAIHPSAVTNSVAKDSVAVAFISFSGLGSFLRGDFLQNKTLLSGRNLESIHLNSRVVSASSSKQTEKLPSPVNLTFEHLENKGNVADVICVHLNTAEADGAWSTEGCQCLHSNSTHSDCSCQYMSSFAVLMSSVPMKGHPALTIISNIGLSVSIICLFLSIITFIFCHSIQSSSTFIHLQLSLFLFFADLLFIMGIDKAYNKVLCSVIAGMLQYLFLGCFVWMFLEGINLYLIVKNLKVANYSGASKRVKISMYLCGYGVPLMIVAISAAVVPGAYGTHYHCWLDTEKGFTWSFLGPVCAIIVINSVLFCLILKILHEKMSSLNSKISTLKNTRSLTVKAISHVFILGVTWCFGLFQYGPMAEIMKYLFILTNSVQGAFIFLVHCLLNKKVRETYRHWICCGKDTQPPVSDISMTSVPSSIPVVNLQNTSPKQQGITWGEEASSSTTLPH
ncbi:adhesion G protein-coupled receptor E3-like isoform X1 [Hemicordylus capensis]|uniref:adhesion G protein-coupled receptor E3-like isoform X1 n=1 Tax=Hemicordylus capensis TaxID=884348 RepID=UPI0023032B36|nr:adhesion G protein-coupled receptor E3-like isoform X1 [Hemicordylus capensis]